MVDRSTSLRWTSDELASTEHLTLVEHVGWTVDGRARPDLSAGLDVDLCWTPATNTLAIRRLDLGIGGRASIDATWVRWPELDVVRARQTYARLAVDRYRYDSGGQPYELQVDQVGLVTRYGDDLWTGRPDGPESASPVDPQPPD